MTRDEVDELFEWAGAEIAEHLWSDRINWPLAGVVDPDYYPRRVAEAKAERNARVLEYIRAR